MPAMFCERVNQLLQDLNSENYAVAVEIAQSVQQVRGFGHIKQRNIEDYKARQEVLLDRFYGREEKVVRIAARQVA